MKIIVLIVLILKCFGFGRAELEEEPVKQPRIFNGNDAKLGMFPHHALITIDFEKFTFLCGGSLIYPEWVLTAAHCLAGAFEVTVHLGTVHLKPSNDSNHVTLKSKELILHEKFNGFKYDIALIKLPTPVEYTKYIRAVQLPTKKKPNKEKYGYTTGFGRQGDYGAISETLKYIEVAVTGDIVCAITFGIQLANQLICVKGLNSTKTCSGDSGGGLITKRGKTLIGINSIGQRHGHIGAANGFVNVAKFLNWIESKTKFGSASKDSSNSDEFRDENIKETEEILDSQKLTSTEIESEETNDEIWDSKKFKRSIKFPRNNLQNQVDNKNLKTKVQFTNDLYVFKSLSNETEMKQFNLGYCTSNNHYDRFLIVNGEKQFLSKTKIFHKLTYSTLNMQRKVDEDWRMVYLVRTASSAHGKIHWTFDFDLPIRNVNLTLDTQTYGDGKVQVQILDGSYELLPSVESLRNLNAFSIIATLVPGEKNNSWQHAQLFRQGMLLESMYWPFEINIEFQ